MACRASLQFRVEALAYALGLHTCSRGFHLHATGSCLFCLLLGGLLSVSGLAQPPRFRARDLESQDRHSTGLLGLDRF